MQFAIELQLKSKAEHVTVDAEATTPAATQSGQVTAIVLMLRAS